MDMPRSERTRIIIIGRCNAGKSALANAIAGQEVAITSPVAGTTTDPVAKAVELPGLGACVITDTPGLDDGTPLGRQRMERTRQALNTADIAIIAAPRAECGELERRCAAELRRRGIPFITVATFMQHILSYQNHTWEDAPLVHANACTGKGIGKAFSETLDGLVGIAGRFHIGSHKLRVVPISGEQSLPEAGQRRPVGVQFINFDFRNSSEH